MDAFPQRLADLFHDPGFRAALAQEADGECARHRDVNECRPVVGEFAHDVLND
jgi:hypothetical protein